MADILEFLDEEDSSGVLCSVLEKSENSLASLTDAEDCPRRCWYESKFVAYKDKPGADNASTLLQESRVGMPAAGGDCKNGES